MLEPIRDGIVRLFTLGLRRPADAQRDADEELAAHLAERAALLEARGFSPDEARAEAARRLGMSEACARRMLRRSAMRRERRMSIREWAHGWRADASYVCRGARREPAFFAFVILTLALGIGANAALFGVVDRLLVRGPAHVVDPGRVVRLFWTWREGSGAEQTVAALDVTLYANLVAEARAFSAIGQFNGPGEMLFGPEDNLRFVQRADATPGFFTVLGVRPVLGRFFTEEEGNYRNTDRVVVLGYALWQSDFGGDRSIVGRTIPIGLRTHTVIGVAPRGFTGANLDRVDIWFPLRVRVDSQARVWPKPKGHAAGPGTVARLKPGMSLEAAGVDATTAHRHTYDGLEKDWAEGRVTVGPLHFGRNGAESDETRIAKWLVGLSVIVLLVACANIVNLLLARATRRRRELAVRLSLGAGRARLVRLLLTEAMLLALAGGVAAIGIATAIGGVVHRVLVPHADWSGGIVDSRVLAFTLVATLFTGLLLGVAPAVRGGSVNLVDALKSTTRDGAGHRSPMRTALTISQAGLATLLLSGASLFVASFEKVRTLDLGVQSERVVEITPSRRPMSPDLAPEVADRERLRREQFATEALARVRILPMVEHAAIADGFPLGGNIYGLEVTVPGLDSLPRLAGDSRWTNFASVSPDYFATVGTTILRGRAFTDEDRAGSVRVAIVNKSMADLVWPGRDPVGQCLLINLWTRRECTTVVGVAADTRRRVRELPSRFLYVPFRQYPDRATALRLLIRPKGVDPTSSIPGLQQAVRALDPTIRYVNASLLQERIEPDFRTWRVGAIMFSLFAALALVVAAVGLFSVVAYLVEQRRHEIGVRVALGAQTGEVVALLLGGAVGTTAAGVLLGAALSFTLSRLAQPLLFETSARNPTVLSGVALVLVATAVVASGVPALRARRIDPMLALRDE